MTDLPVYPQPAGPGSGAPAVLLVHYGDPELTRRCIASLGEHEGIPYRVYVSDQGPGAPLDLSGLPGRPVALRRENLGFASGCNAAAQAALADGAAWLWFLNNDAMLEGPLLSQLLDTARQAPGVGLWGTFQREGDRLLGPDTLPRWFGPSGKGAPLLPPLPAACRQLGPRETLSGASIFLSRETWERLGPWPEWCFLYWEDVAWCLRAHQLALPLAVMPGAILHQRNSTTGHHSPLSTYYGVRNGLLLHRDLWPEARGARLRQGLHLLQKRLFQGRIGMLGPTWRGIRDAWRGMRGRKG